MSASSSRVVAPFGRYLSFEEARQFLGDMPVSRLRRLVAAKKIPCIRDGRLAFLESDLRAWLEERRQAGLPTAPAARNEPRPSTSLLKLVPGDVSHLIKRRRLG